jgi:hypothetical protein
MYVTYEERVTYGRCGWVEVLMRSAHARTVIPADGAAWRLETITCVMECDVGMVTQVAVAADAGS